MLNNYLVVALRNLLRNKTNSIINILSLSVAMAICLTICQYVYVELTYDTFHHNYRNIFRVVVDEIKPDGEPYPYPYETGYAVGVTAKQELPEITDYTRVHKYSGGAVIATTDNSKIFTEDALNMFFVDKSFLQVFDFKLKSGKKESAFNDKFNIVITEKTARKYFDSIEALGNTLVVNGGVSPGNYTVTGILEDLPVNSHLQFDFLLPVENYMEFGWGGAALKNDDGWTSPDFATYVTIDQSADLKIVSEKLDQLISTQIRQRHENKNVLLRSTLQPIADIHLRSNSNVDQSLVKNSGDYGDVKFFSILAFFILLIALVNYVNLSTAQSIHRAKEVGIRKSIGAFKDQLIQQFMIESFVVNLISAMLSVGLASLILPILSIIIEIEMEFSLLTVAFFWWGFLFVMMLGTLLSGVFPAFVLSSFKPISMLGAYKAGKPGGFNLRKGLITFQFLISLLLLAGSYLVYKQITFMKNHEMGMEVEKILVLKGPEVNLDRPVLESTLQSFTKKAADHHTIAAVAASSSVPGKGYNTGITIRKLGAPEGSEKFGRVIFAGFDLPTAYDLKFVSGHSPTPEMLNSKEVVVVINEEAVKTFELGSPENALNEQLFYKNDTFKIVGVVKNFHWHSLADAHTPYLFEFYNDCRSYFSFRINTASIGETLTYVESTFNSSFPGNAFEYFFLEDEFNKQYKSDIRFGNLFLGFTLLAMFIACIGLFALVSYSAILKIKEIGIRKVMGASIGSIMMLLSREYLTLLLAANLVAIPAIFYGGNVWLANYAFRTTIGVETLVIPGFVVAFVSLATVSFRTFSAACADPVKSLRSE